MSRIAIVTGMVGFILGSGSLLSAEFYRYEDNSGTVHFVEDRNSIPPEYRDRKQVYRDEHDELPEGERQQLIERQRALRQQQLKKEQARDAAARLDRKREEDEAARLDALRALETPVLISGNQVFVPVTLTYGSNSTQAMLLLDTGASISLITAEVASRLQIDQVGAARIKGVGGKVLRAQQAKLAQLKAGPASREDMSVVILRERSSSGFGDGLLGMDFLRGFKYTIDFTRQLMVWEP